MPSTQKLIVDLLRRHKALSRSELSELIGITPASISVQTRTMIGNGLLREGAKLRDRSRGQPAVALELEASAAFSAGFSMSPNHISTAIMDLAGKVIAVDRHSNDFGSVDGAIAFTRDKLVSLLEQHKLDRKRLTSVGLALSANFVGPSGAISQAPSLQRWENADLVGSLQEALGCEVMPENDATAAAYCEQQFGNEDDFSSFYYVYIGMGLGGAPVLDGACYRGANGNAGRLGMLKKWGVSRPSLKDLLDHLEQYGHVISGLDALEALFVAQPDLFDDWLTRAADQLADLLYMATVFYDPAGIILGGTMPLCLLDALKVRIDFGRVLASDRKALQQPPLAVSQHSGAFAAATGAAAIALNAL